MHAVPASMVRPQPPAPWTIRRSCQQLARGFRGGSSQARHAKREAARRSPSLRGGCGRGAGGHKRCTQCVHRPCVSTAPAPWAIRRLRRPLARGGPRRLTPGTSRKARGFQVLPFPPVGGGGWWLIRALHAVRASPVSQHLPAQELVRRVCRPSELAVRAPSAPFGPSLFGSEADPARGVQSTPPAGAPPRAPVPSPLPYPPCCACAAIPYPPRVTRPRRSLAADAPPRLPPAPCRALLPTDRPPSPPARPLPNHLLASPLPAPRATPCPSCPTRPQRPRTGGGYPAAFSARPWLPAPPHTLSAAPRALSRTVCVCVPIRTLHAPCPTLPRALARALLVQLGLSGGRAGTRARSPAPARSGRSPAPSPAPSAPTRSRLQDPPSSGKPLPVFRCP